MAGPGRFSFPVAATSREHPRTRRSHVRSAVIVELMNYVPASPLLALAENKLLHIDWEGFVSALPLLAPAVLFLAWYRSWHKLAMPTSGGGGRAAAGGSKRGKSKAVAVSGGGSDVEPPVYLIAALVLFGSGAALSIGSGQLFAAVWKEPGSLRTLSAALLLTYALAAPIAIALGVMLARSAPAAAGWLTIQLRSVALGAALMLLCWPIVLGVNLITVLAVRYFSGAEPPQIAHTQLQQILDNRDSPWAWGLIAAAVIGAPIVEEVLYRGLLLRGVLLASRMPWLSVLLTSALFAGVHVGATGAHALPQLFALSICISIALLHTGKLGVAVGMHIMFNLLNVLLAIAITR